MGNVRNELREDGDEIILTKTIDDAPYQEHVKELRRANGKGMIRNGQGAAVGRRLLSIPMEEAAMLSATNDADWLEWWNTDSNASLMRLIKRFPHWVACEGGGLV